MTVQTPLCLLLLSLGCSVHGLKVPVKAPSKNCDVSSEGKWEHVETPETQYIIQEAAGAKVRDSMREFKKGFGNHKDKFPEFMKYNWVPSGDCAMLRATPKTLCAIMDKRNLTTVSIVGDSLNFMMAQSMWKMLQLKGEPKQPKKDSNGVVDFPENSKKRGFQGQVICPSQRTVTFQFIRNDQLDDTQEKHRCSDICMPWWDSYIKNAKKTLLVVNTGLHDHSEKRFNASFTKFVDRISKIDAGVVVFRSSVPGHEDCMKNQKPFDAPAQFSLSNQYSWDLVPQFNAVAKAKLENLKKPAVFKYLDVYPMTILRPDGHRSSSDCLHYNLPGVPDWWNHMLVTTLSQ